MTWQCTYSCLLRNESTVFGTTPTVIFILMWECWGSHKDKKKISLTDILNIINPRHFNIHNADFTKGENILIKTFTLRKHFRSTCTGKLYYESMHIFLYENTTHAHTHFHIPWESPAAWYERRTGRKYRWGGGNTTKLTPTHPLGCTNLHGEAVSLYQGNGKQCLKDRLHYESRLLVGSLKTEWPKLGNQIKIHPSSSGINYHISRRKVTMLRGKKSQKAAIIQQH